jgi:hypothetical protein
MQKSTATIDALPSACTGAQSSKDVQPPHFAPAEFLRQAGYVIAASLGFALLGHIVVAVVAQ